MIKTVESRQMWSKYVNYGPLLVHFMVKTALLAMVRGAVLGLRLAAVQQCRDEYGHAYRDGYGPVPVLSRLWPSPSTKSVMAQFQFN